MMRSCRKEIILNFIVWVVAHNLPLFSALCLDAYFDREHAVGAVWVLGILLIVRLCLIRTGAYTDIRCQQACSRYFYQRLFVRLENTHAKLSNGEIENGINDDVDTIAGTLSYSIDTVSNVLFGIVSIAILASIQATLTLWLIVLPSLAFLLHFFMKKRIATQNEALKRSSQWFSSQVNDAFEHARKIRIEGKEPAWLRDLENGLQTQRKAGVRSSLLSSFVASVSALLMDANLLVIVAYYVLDPTMTPGDLILFTTYSFDLSGIVQYVSSLVLALFGCRVNRDHLEALVFVPPEEQAPQSKETVDIIPGTVNVLIGKNGSGKTAILKRIWENDASAVWLPEHVHLFHDSIARNIALEQDFSIKDQDWFDVRPLLDHTIDQLSGGERLRVGLARTFAHSRNTVLLDHNLISLHPSLRKEIIEMFLRSRKTIVLTDTRNREIYAACHRVEVENENSKS